MENKNNQHSNKLIYIYKKNNKFFWFGVATLEEFAHHHIHKYTSSPSLCSSISSEELFIYHIVWGKQRRPLYMSVWHNLALLYLRICTWDSKNSAGETSAPSGEEQRKKLIKTNVRLLHLFLHDLKGYIHAYKNKPEGQLNKHG